MSDTSMANTNRELFREGTGDVDRHYNNSVHVTEDGKIGMNVGGTVIVLPVVEWHAAVLERDQLRGAIAHVRQQLNEWLERLED